jgi:hypothetical protein
MPALRIAALAAVVLLTACGEQDDGAAVVTQPPGCVEALEPTQETPTADDVVLGDAILVSLRTSQRLPWRELWLPTDKLGMVKLPILVPAGKTLTLTIPPVARRVISLDYRSEDRPTRVTDGQLRVRLTGCIGRFAMVFFPGRLLVARPVCGVPLDWRYGRERGRVRLSFGGGCRRSMTRPGVA